ncbi:hypothetical protein RF11_11568 [Thelohanellus kitauei]|uniref:Reverse transcriptase domain-containing protein n=1 Tax=Thelohanellus kitauei TaxID=669202 RepID=A0A0C2IIM4_THEKT|nr:hypothetical protein RF11_11568 [Thelohanellus kitauei]
MAVENEFALLVKKGILEMIEPSIQEVAWDCQTFNVIKEDGTVRNCGDFRCTLNNYVEIPQCALPKLDDILDMVRGGQKFSVLDLKDSYLKVPSDNKAKILA